MSRKEAVLELTDPQYEINVDGAPEFVDETGERALDPLKGTRFRVVIAGRRFGKTHLAAYELLLSAWNKPKSVNWYLAPTYGMAKDVMWAKLMEIVPADFIMARDVTELKLVLRNGSVIALRSADNPDRLRGSGLDFLVLDEAAYMPATVWPTIRPNLSDKMGRALFISTPAGYNWFYKDIYLQALNRPDWKVFEYTTAEGGNVPLSEIEAAKTEMDERMFKQEFEASFESLAGRVYYAFDRKKNVTPLWDEHNLPLLVGLDFNINPMSAVFAIKAGGQLHVIGEYEIPSGNTEDMVRYIKRKYPGRSIRVFPDPTGNARRTSAPVGQTDFTILRKAGFQVLAPGKPYPVADKINTVNAGFCNANGERRILIDGKCKSLCAALDGLTYRPDSSEPDKSLGLDHITDALGYLVLWELPMRTPVRRLSILGI